MVKSAFMEILSHKRLPLSFDPKRLAKDLELIPEDAWQTHYNSYVYVGGWSTAPLVAAGGELRNAKTHWGYDFKPTPILGPCSYFREVLQAFKSPFRRVRLLKLNAGARIKEHADYLDHDNLDIKIHIPIVTHPDVSFHINGERIVMRPGETWYTEVALPHKVRNRSTIDRVHMVVECRINEFVNDLIGFDLRKHRAEHVARFKQVEKKHRRINNMRRTIHGAKNASRLIVTNPSKFPELVRNRLADLSAGKK